MKILLVLPDGRINKLVIPGLLDISFREAPLTATMLAALIPSQLEAEVDIIDESVGQKIDFNKGYDLVGISVLTGTALRAYQIADEFRRQEVTVVLGGVHVSLLPEEAASHADSIVIGFAEKTWPQLLSDFCQGRLKRLYRDSSSDLDNLPLPRRQLQKRFGYMAPNTVLVTRGCRGQCDFCSVPAARFGWQKRPIGQVIAEMKGIPSRYIPISDVHLTQDADYAKELFQAMIPLRKRWGALASTQVADDAEMLELMRQSGCSYLLLGFESISAGSLASLNKKMNNAKRYRQVVETLHSYGIVVQGCFIFGADEDTSDIFERTLSFVDEVKMDIPRYAVLTPYPQTPLFQRLASEDRILHKNWHYYDTQHVVFRPKQMSTRELDSGFKRAYRESFSLKRALTRAAGTSGNSIIVFLGNLAYSLYARRLLSDRVRFPQGLVN